jgi:hypothetical protein
MFVLVTNTALTGETILEYYRERDGQKDIFTAFGIDFGHLT